MPFAVGMIIYIVVASWILGGGNFEKGARRVFIGQWIVLALVLLGIGGVVLYTLGGAICDIAGR